MNSLSFEVPADASVESSTFAKFRFSDTGGQSYTGQADVGEVEDYELSASETCEISLVAGWNLVSVPVRADDMAVSAIFPGVDPVYTWNATQKAYTIPTPIEPHRGYWVSTSSSRLLSIEGVPVGTWTAGIESGWNTVGSVYGTVADVSVPNDTPGGSVEAFDYRWDAPTKSYVYTTSIEPGKGYWIATTQAASLTLD